MNINSTKIVLIVGILIRFVLIPHTGHPGTYEKSQNLDYLFILGELPTIRDTAFGISYYLIYAPAYIFYNFLSEILNIRYDFVLASLLKMPPFVGDLIIFYALYEIVRLKVNRKLALPVASAYFLNPYVIWLGSAVGNSNNLDAAFLLLSFLYLIKHSYIKGGSFFGIAVFFRFFPVLLLPALIFYILSQKEDVNKRLTKFLIGFIGFSSLLVLPYFLVIIKLYLLSPSSLTQYIFHISGASSATAAYMNPNIEYFMYNFTGFLATLGFYSKLKILYGAKSFLLTFLAIQAAIILYLRKKGLSANQLLHFPVILFALFLIQIPLQQHHYLQWAFPFLLLSSRAFGTAPAHFLTIAWLSNLLIDPIISQSYKYYFGITFPNPFPDKTKYLLSIPLQQSISVLSGAIFALYVSFAIRELIRKEPRRESEFNSLESSLGDSKSVLFIGILLVAYGAIEILKITYEVYFITNTVLILFGLYILFELSKVLRKYKILDINLKIGNINMPVLPYIVSLFIFSILIAPSNLSIMIFLITNILILGFIIGSESPSLKMLQSISYIFTFLVTTLAVLVHTSQLILLSYILVFASWILIQLKSNVARIRTDKSVIIEMHESVPELNKRKTLMLLVVFLVIQFILFKPVIEGDVPNRRSIWCCINWKVEGTEISGFVERNISHQTWEFKPIWITPFLTEEMKKASTAYVMLTGKFKADEFNGSGSTSTNLNETIIEIALNGNLIYNSAPSSPRDVLEVTIPIQYLKPENKLEVTDTTGSEVDSVVIQMNFNSEKVLSTPFWKKFPFSGYLFGGILLIYILLIVRSGREFIRVLKN